jgi:hypothetical protein
MKYSKAKIAAAVLLACQGFYYAITQPSGMDCINGLLHGFVFFALFCAQDPKPEKQEE